MPVGPSTTSLRRIKRVTLAEVAAASGLARTTISDILNRDKAANYSEETRRKAMEVVSRLGYSPARSAQNLARGRSGQIGLLLTRDFSNPFFARSAFQAEQEISHRNYRMQMAFTNVDPATELFRMQQMEADAVEGLLVGPVYEKYDLRLHRNIFSGRIPIVLFGEHLGSEFDEVLLDHRAGWQLAAAHLHELGHRRIGFLCSPAARTSDSPSLAFSRTFPSLGLTNPRWIFEQNDTGRYEDFYATASAFATAWLAASPEDRPTAMLCHNDQCALAAIAALSVRGIRVPQDLSLVGFDNLPESAYFLPALTTIDNHVDQQMKIAVAQLFRRIDDPELPKRDTLVPPSLVVRHSTMPLQI